MPAWWGPTHDLPPPPFPRPASSPISAPSLAWSPSHTHAAHVPSPHGVDDRAASARPTPCWPGLIRGGGHSWRERVLENHSEPFAVPSPPPAWQLPQASGWGSGAVDPARLAEAEESMLRSPWSARPRSTTRVAAAPLPGRATPPAVPPLHAPQHSGVQRATGASQLQHASQHDAAAYRQGHHASLPLSGHQPRPAPPGLKGLPPRGRHPSSQGPQADSRYGHPVGGRPGEHSPGASSRHRAHRAAPLHAAAPLPPPGHVQGYAAWHLPPPPPFAGSKAAAMPGAAQARRGAPPPPPPPPPQCMWGVARRMCSALALVQVPAVLLGAVGPELLVPLLLAVLPMLGAAGEAGFGDAGAVPDPSQRGP
jgi:hypothetical protein